MDWHEWAAEFYRQALASRDAERVRLVGLVEQAYALREKDPGRSLSVCDEGRRLAERLGEPWWALCYRAQALQGLVHFLRDFRRAREQAVALTLEARKRVYDGCPLRDLVYKDLLAVHFCTDPDGYAGPIEEGLREVERLARPDFESRLGLLNLRRWRAEQSRRPEEHNVAARRALALIAEKPNHFASLHYSTFIYNGLCHMTCAGGAWEELAETAALALEASRKVGNRVSVAEALLWQALHAAHHGDATSGRRLCRQGIRVMSGLGVPPPDGYFTALALCWESLERPEGALAARERELGLLRAQGRTISEVFCHRERCRLLLALERLTRADLDNARAAACELRLPEPHLAEFDRLAAAGGIAD